MPATLWKANHTGNFKRARKSNRRLNVNTNFPVCRRRRRLREAEADRRQDEGGPDDGLQAAAQPLHPGTGRLINISPISQLINCDLPLKGAPQHEGQVGQVRLRHDVPERPARLQDGRQQGGHLRGLPLRRALQRDAHARLRFPALQVRLKIQMEIKPFSFCDFPFML